MRKPPKACTHTEKDYILAYAEKHGAQAASNEFHLHKSTIYAWKAAQPAKSSDGKPATDFRLSDSDGVFRLIEALKAERDLAQQQLDRAREAIDRLPALTADRDQAEQRLALALQVFEMLQSRLKAEIPADSPAAKASVASSNA